MRNTSRFECASSSLTLTGLLKKTRRVVWICFAVGALGHLSLTQFAGLEVERRGVKPLTTHFIKRQPRLTKPLELKKLPQPKRRLAQRKMVSVKAKIARYQQAARFRPVQSLRALAKPTVAMGRAPGFGPPQMEPQAVAAVIQAAKEDKHKIDMRVELLDIGALDTGRYRAMVIEDPSDKRSLRGFLYLGMVYVESMFAKLPQVAQLDLLDYIRNVVHAMNKYTDINTELRGRYTFDSAEMLHIPWVFLNTSGTAFKLTRSEAMNLGRYLTGGGFFFLENSCAHPWDRPGHPFGMLYRHEFIAGQDMFKDGMAAAGHRYGLDWTFERIPSEHPLYHCYFDFDGPLPSYWPDYVSTDDVIHGITIDGRLLAIYETGDYERFVNDIGGVDGTRHRQFLVNVVIYALTQQGSITHRLMDSIQ